MEIVLWTKKVLNSTNEKRPLHINYPPFTPLASGHDSRPHK